MGTVKVMTASQTDSVIRLIQIQNELIDSMVWSRSPKKVFCDILGLTIFVIVCLNLTLS